MNIEYCATKQRFRIGSGAQTPSIAQRIRCRKSTEIGGKLKYCI